jgi:hypothetical protein
VRLHALLRYFHFKLDAETDSVGGEYYMPWRWSPNSAVNPAVFNAA